MKIIEKVLQDKGLADTEENQDEIRFDGCPSDFGYHDLRSKCHEDGHGCPECWEQKI